MAEAADTQHLWRQFRTNKGDKALRDRLILTYAPLVKYVAGRLGSGLPAHVDEGDLVSYGLLGLIGANSTEVNQQSPHEQPVVTRRWLYAQHSVLVDYVLSGKC